jgi:thioredoxin-related protein
MRKLLFVATLLSSFLFGDINWNMGFNDAKAKAMSENKILMLFVTQDGCRACDYMKYATLQKDSVVEELQRYFVPIQLHRDFLPSKTYIKGTPTFLFYKPSNGKRLKYRILGGFKETTFLKKISGLRKALLKK